MATIKPIEGRSVHQIQSGQVIVDLCSVVKELVENSLDAKASSIDVRFKNYGMDAVEVQDNGAGIASNDYETIALKHYTSKLSNYDDLDSLQTFGFRGEALSSLCALSNFYIVTAREEDAPKGVRLDFETSGSLKTTTVAASQKGTTVCVEDIFNNLPVRRRELQKNIKREYSKALSVLQAYACVSTNVRLSVSNQAAKGKKTVAFATNSNANVKDNIANVFGAKTLLALIKLDLDLELQPTATNGTDTRSKGDKKVRRVQVKGHVSKPVFGEGRQAPDRQLFFVNSRPCGLPQIAKAVNEVYKSYNVTQSPFVFADLKMDTGGYDINVSPDKRTILLHDQSALLESLKASLSDLFEVQEQTVPESTISFRKLPAFKARAINQAHLASPANDADGGDVDKLETVLELEPRRALPKSKEDLGQELLTSSEVVEQEPPNPPSLDVDRSTSQIFVDLAGEGSATLNYERTESGTDLGSKDTHDTGTFVSDGQSRLQTVADDFNARLASQLNARDNAGPHGSQPIELSTNVSHQLSDVIAKTANNPQVEIFSSGQFVAANAEKRLSKNTDLPSFKKRRIDTSETVSISPTNKKYTSKFGRSLSAFAAPHFNTEDVDDDESDHHDTQERILNHQTLNKQTKPGPLEQPNDATRPREDSSRDSNGADSDAEDPHIEFVDEIEKRAEEEERVRKIVQDAEENARRPSEDNLKRAARALHKRSKRDSTLVLVQKLETTCESIRHLDRGLRSSMQLASLSLCQSDPVHKDDIFKSSNPTAEERLSLAISKSDFKSMRVVGQFNLGFILATRNNAAISHEPSTTESRSLREPEDLFIIDQHASDEIYNFHRLSDNTTLTPQPLVVPRTLELNAVEEETVMAHEATFAKNGFNISINASGNQPVGQRCKLLTLPTSRETVFDTRDLEELIALLHDTAPTAGGVVRPGKVRRMLAMRACRSSIMIGRTLTKKAMVNVVRNMGDIERPWNCPHGRPTMRHLAGLADWTSWEEGVGLADDEGEDFGNETVGDDKRTDWAGFIDRAKDR